MRFLCTCLLGAALLAPVALQADDHDQRYYDRDHRDWHDWNEHEQHAYRRYLEERHLAYREWRKLNAKEQRAYWRWRHDHPDVH